MTKVLGSGMDLKSHPCLLHIHWVKLTSNTIDFVGVSFLYVFYLLSNLSQV